MKKNKILIIIALIIILPIGGYFVVTGIQLRQIEFKMWEELQKPKTGISFWNHDDKPAVIKLTYQNNDEVQWINIHSNGGSYASYDVGEAKLELMLYEKVLHTVNLTLKKGGKADLRIHNNEIKPK